MDALEKDLQQANQEAEESSKKYTEQVLKDEILETPMCSIGTAEQVANQLQLQRQIDDTQNKLRSLEIQKSEWQDQAAQEELAAAERQAKLEKLLSRLGDGVPEELKTELQELTAGPLGEKRRKTATAATEPPVQQQGELPKPGGLAGRQRTQSWQNCGGHSQVKLDSCGHNGIVRPSPRRGPSAESVQVEPWVVQFANVTSFSLKAAEHLQGAETSVKVQLVAEHHLQKQALSSKQRRLWDPGWDWRGKAPAAQAGVAQVEALPCW